jgi:hypothetical protein
VVRALERRDGRFAIARGRVHPYGDHPELCRRRSQPAARRLSRGRAGAVRPGTCGGLAWRRPPPRRPRRCRPGRSTHAARRRRRPPQRLRRRRGRPGTHGGATRGAGPGRPRAAPRGRGRPRRSVPWSVSVSPTSSRTARILRVGPLRSIAMRCCIVMPAARRWRMRCAISS